VKNKVPATKTGQAGIFSRFGGWKSASLRVRPTCWMSSRWGWWPIRCRSSCESDTISRPVLRDLFGRVVGAAAAAGRRIDQPPVAFVKLLPGQRLGGLAEPVEERGVGLRVHACRGREEARPGGSGESAEGATVQTATKASTRLYMKTLPPGAEVTLDGKPLEQPLEFHEAPLRDVTDRFRQAAGIDVLIDLIQSCVAADTWDTVGGSGSIRSDSTALVISTSLELQRQIAGFLDVLRRLKATPAEDRRPLGFTCYWSDMPAAIAARAALDKPVTVDFAETPLREVTADLAKDAGVSITVDTRALEDAGLDLETPVTFRLSGKPLAVVLDRSLETIDLAWEVRDEGLLVTTREKSDETLTVAVYPVGHLAGGDRSVGSLAELVTSVVTPDTWDTVGGAAVVRPVDGDVPCLVILQTTAGHRQVHELLESLPPSRQPGGFAPTPEADVQP